MVLMAASHWFAHSPIAYLYHWTGPVMEARDHLTCPLQRLDSSIFGCTPRSLEWNSWMHSSNFHVEMIASFHFGNVHSVVYRHDFLLDIQRHIPPHELALATWSSSAGPGLARASSLNCPGRCILRTAWYCLRFIVPITEVVLIQFFSNLHGHQYASASEQV